MPLNTAPPSRPRSDTLVMLGITGDLAKKKLIPAVYRLHCRGLLGIPIVGIVDSNNSLDGIDYIIPGNDDSTRAIRLYARGVADAILEGRSQVINEMVAQPTEDFVEVEESEKQ